MFCSLSGVLGHVTRVSVRPPNRGMNVCLLCGSGCKNPSHLSRRPIFDNEKQQTGLLSPHYPVLSPLPSVSPESLRPRGPQSSSSPAFSFLVLGPFNQVEMFFSSAVPRAQASSQRSIRFNSPQTGGFFFPVSCYSNEANLQGFSASI